jgi:hypothetical protein
MTAIMTIIKAEIVLSCSAAAGGTDGVPHPALNRDTVGNWLLLRPRRVQQDGYLAYLNASLRRLNSVNNQADGYLC